MAGRKQRISEHDLWEIVKFKEYLGDMQIMKREPFYRKYQEYMGLTDDELGVAARASLERKP